MKKYQETRIISSENNEKKDCAVVATSIVTGIEYEKVLQMFKDNGRHSGSETQQTIIIDVLDYMVQNKFIKSWNSVKPRSEYEYWAYSVDANGDDIRERKTKRGKWSMKKIVENTGIQNAIALTSKHAAGICDGIVEDWSNGTRKVVNELYVVERNPAKPARKNVNKA